MSLNPSIAGYTYNEPVAIPEEFRALVTEEQLVDNERKELEKRRKMERDIEQLEYERIRRVRARR